MPGGPRARSLSYFGRIVRRPGYFARSEIEKLLDKDKTSAEEADEASEEDH